MSWLAAGTTAVAAVGSTLGSASAASSAKAGLNYQKGQSQKSSLTQFNALAQSNAQMQPYTQAGQYAMPLLTYTQTGQNPYTWDDSMESEYNTLKDNEQALNNRYQLIMSSATGSRKNQRKYAAEGAKISSQLARLKELENNKAGYEAISSYSMEETPNYKYQQQQGEQALNRNLAARGMYNSRAGVNALSDFNQSLSAQESDKTFNRLSTLANYGMGAAANVGNYNMTTGANISNSLANFSSQIADGYNNVGEKEGSTWANALAAPAAIYQSYQQAKAINGLNKPQA